MMRPPEQGATVLSLDDLEDEANIVLLNQLNKFSRIPS
jgi:hypothetical protein